MSTNITQNIIYSIIISCLFYHISGRNCEADVNECNSRPCENGGSCINMVNGYACRCPPGFEGTNCEKGVDHCSPNYCLNGATCHSGKHTFTCECPPEYTGILCFDDVDECQTHSFNCTSRGECTNTHGGYECECTDGYEGDNCELETDECLSETVPCNNGGICVDGIGGYKCECVAGFAGSRCEINTDECDSLPCLNNGTCIDEIDGFTCLCDVGYIGTQCENPDMSTGQILITSQSSTSAIDFHSYTSTLKTEFLTSNASETTDNITSPSTLALNFTQTTTATPNVSMDLPAITQSSSQLILETGYSTTTQSVKSTITPMHLAIEILNNTEDEVDIYLTSTKPLDYYTRDNITDIPSVNISTPPEYEIYDEDIDFNMTDEEFFQTSGDVYHEYDILLGELDHNRYSEPTSDEFGHTDKQENISSKYVESGEYDSTSEEIDEDSKELGHIDKQINISSEYVGSGEYDKTSGEIDEDIFSGVSGDEQPDPVSVELLGGESGEILGSAYKFSEAYAEGFISESSGDENLEIVSGDEFDSSSENLVIARKMVDPSGVFELQKDESGDFISESSEDENLEIISGDEFDSSSENAFIARKVVDSLGVFELEKGESGVSGEENSLIKELLGDLKGMLLERDYSGDYVEIMSGEAGHIVDSGESGYITSNLAIDLGLSSGHSEISESGSTQDIIETGMDSGGQTPEDLYSESSGKSSSEVYEKDMANAYLYPVLDTVNVIDESEASAEFIKVSEDKNLGNMPEVSNFDDRLVNAGDDDTYSPMFEMSGDLSGDTNIERQQSKTYANTSRIDFLARNIDETKAKFNLESSGIETTLESGEKWDEYLVIESTGESGVSDGNTYSPMFEMSGDLSDDTNVERQQSKKYADTDRVDFLATDIDKTEAKSNLESSGIETTLESGERWDEYLVIESIGESGVSDGNTYSPMFEMSGDLSDDTNVERQQSKKYADTDRVDFLATDIDKTEAKSNLESSGIETTLESGERWDEYLVIESIGESGVSDDKGDQQDGALSEKDDDEYSVHSTDQTFTDITSGESSEIVSGETIHVTHFESGDMSGDLSEDFIGGLSKDFSGEIDFEKELSQKYADINRLNYQVTDASKNEYELDSSGEGIFPSREISGDIAEQRNVSLDMIGKHSSNFGSSLGLDTVINEEVTTGIQKRYMVETNKGREDDDTANVFAIEQQSGESGDSKDFSKSLDVSDRNAYLFESSAEEEGGDFSGSLDVSDRNTYIFESSGEEGDGLESKNIIFGWADSGSEIDTVNGFESSSDDELYGEYIIVTPHDMKEKHKLMDEDSDSKIMVSSALDDTYKESLEGSGEIIENKIGVLNEGYLDLFGQSSSTDSGSSDSPIMEDRETGSRFIGTGSGEFLDKIFNASDIFYLQEENNGTLPSFAETLSQWSSTDTSTETIKLSSPIESDSLIMEEGDLGSGFIETGSGESGSEFLRPPKGNNGNLFTLSQVSSTDTKTRASGTFSLSSSTGKPETTGPVITSPGVNPENSLKNVTGSGFTRMTPFVFFNYTSENPRNLLSTKVIHHTTKPSLVGELQNRTLHDHRYKLSSPKTLYTSSKNVPEFQSTPIAIQQTKEFSRIHPPFTAGNEGQISTMQNTLKVNKSDKLESSEVSTVRTTTPIVHITMKPTPSRKTLSNKCLFRNPSQIARCFPKFRIPAKHPVFRTTKALPVISAITSFLTESTIVNETTSSKQKTTPATPDLFRNSITPLTTMPRTPRSNDTERFVTTTEDQRAIYEIPSQSISKHSSQTTLKGFTVSPSLGSSSLLRYTTPYQEYSTLAATTTHKVLEDFDLSSTSKYSTLKDMSSNYSTDDGSSSFIDFQKTESVVFEEEITTHASEVIPEYVPAMVIIETIPETISSMNHSFSDIKSMIDYSTTNISPTVMPVYQTFSSARTASAPSSTTRISELLLSSFFPDAGQNTAATKAGQTPINSTTPDENLLQTTEIMYTDYLGTGISSSQLFLTSAQEAYSLSDYEINSIDELETQQITVTNFTTEFYTSSTSVHLPILPSLPQVQVTRVSTLKDPAIRDTTDFLIATVSDNEPSKPFSTSIPLFETEVPSGVFKIPPPPPPIIVPLPQKVESFYQSLSRKPVFKEETDINSSPVLNATNKYQISMKSIESDPSQYPGVFMTLLPPSEQSETIFHTPDTIYIFTELTHTIASIIEIATSHTVSVQSMVDKIPFSSIHSSLDEESTQSSLDVDEATSGRSDMKQSTSISSTGIINLSPFSSTELPIMLSSVAPMLIGQQDVGIKQIIRPSIDETPVFKDVSQMAATVVPTTTQAATSLIFVSNDLNFSDSREKSMNMSSIYPSLSSGQIIRPNYDIENVFSQDRLEDSSLGQDSQGVFQFSSPNLTDHALKSMFFTDINPSTTTYFSQTSTAFEHYGTILQTSFLPKTAYEEDSMLKVRSPSDTSTIVYQGYITAPLSQAVGTMTAQSFYEEGELPASLSLTASSITANSGYEESDLLISNVTSLPSFVKKYDSINVQTSSIKMSPFVEDKSENKTIPDSQQIFYLTKRTQRVTPSTHVYFDFFTRIMLFFKEKNTSPESSYSTNTQQTTQSNFTTRSPHPTQSKYSTNSPQTTELNDLTRILQSLPFNYTSRSPQTSLSNYTSNPQTSQSNYTTRSPQTYTKNGLQTTSSNYTARRTTQSKYTTSSLDTTQFNYTARSPQTTRSNYTISTPKTTQSNFSTSTQQSSYIIGSTLTVQSNYNATVDIAQSIFRQTTASPQISKTTSSSSTSPQISKSHYSTSATSPQTSKSYNITSTTSPQTSQSTYSSSTKSPHTFNATFSSSTISPQTLQSTYSTSTTSPQTSQSIYTSSTSPQTSKSTFSSSTTSPQTSQSTYSISPSSPLTPHSTYSSSTTSPQTSQSTYSTSTKSPHTSKATFSSSTISPQTLQSTNSTSTTSPQTSQSTYTSSTSLQTSKSTYCSSTTSPQTSQSTYSTSPSSPLTPHSTYSSSTTSPQTSQSTYSTSTSPLTSKSYYITSKSPQTSQSTYSSSTKSPHTSKATFSSSTISPQTLQSTYSTSTTSPQASESTYTSSTSSQTSKSTFSSSTKSPHTSKATFSSSTISPQTLQSTYSTSTTSPQASESTYTSSTSSQTSKSTFSSSTTSPQTSQSTYSTSPSSPLTPHSTYSSSTTSPQTSQSTYSSSTKSPHTSRATFSSSTISPETLQSIYSTSTTSPQTSQSTYTSSTSPQTSKSTFSSSTTNPQSPSSPLMPHSTYSSSTTSPQTSQSTYSTSTSPLTSQSTYSISETSPQISQSTYSSSTTSPQTSKSIPSPSTSLLTSQSTYSTRKTSLHISKSTSSTSTNPQTLQSTSSSSTSPKTSKPTYSSSTSPQISQSTYKINTKIPEISQSTYSTSTSLQTSQSLYSTSPHVFQSADTTSSPQKAKSIDSTATGRPQKTLPAYSRTTSTTTIRPQTKVYFYFFTRKFGPGSVTKSKTANTSTDESVTTTESIQAKVEIQNTFETTPTAKKTENVVSNTTSTKQQFVFSHNTTVKPASMITSTPKMGQTYSANESSGTPATSPYDLLKIQSFPSMLNKTAVTPTMQSTLNQTTSSKAQSISNSMTTDTDILHFTSSRKITTMSATSKPVYSDKVQTESATESHWISTSQNDSFSVQSQKKPVMLKETFRTTEDQSMTNQTVRSNAQSISNTTAPFKVTVMREQLYQTSPAPSYGTPSSTMSTKRYREIFNLNKATKMDSTTDTSQNTFTAPTPTSRHRGVSEHTKLEPKHKDNLQSLELIKINTTHNNTSQTLPTSTSIDSSSLSLESTPVDVKEIQLLPQVDNTTTLYQTLKPIFERLEPWLDTFIDILNTEPTPVVTQSFATPNITTSILNSRTTNRSDIILSNISDSISQFEEPSANPIKVTTPFTSIIDMIGRKKTTSIHKTQKQHKTEMSRVAMKQTTLSAHDNSSSEKITDNLENFETSFNREKAALTTDFTVSQKPMVSKSITSPVPIKTTHSKPPVYNIYTRDLNKFSDSYLDKRLSTESYRRTQVIRLRAEIQRNVTNLPVETFTTLTTPAPTASRFIPATIKRSSIRHIIDLTSNNTYPDPRKEIYEYIHNKQLAKGPAKLTLKQITVTVIRGAQSLAEQGKKVVLRTYQRVKNISTAVTVTVYRRSRQLFKTALERVEALWKYCESGINHYIVRPLLDTRVFIKEKFESAYARLSETFNRGKQIFESTVENVGKEADDYFESLANYYTDVYKQYSTEVRDIFSSLKIPDS